MFSNVEREYIYIDSINRFVGGTDTNFIVPVTIKRDRRYDSVVVTQATIPISYYLVASGYNTFKLKEDNTTVTITVPVGNYSIDSFCTVVQALLIANSPNSLTYTMTYNNGVANVLNGLIYFTVTGAHVCSLIMLNNYLYYQFGFVNLSTNTFSGGNLASTNVCNFVNETTVFIHSDLYKNGSDDILQEIFGENATSMSYLTYQCTNPYLYMKKIDPPTSAIRFSVTDENNVLLNTNGLNVQITLLFFNSSDWYIQNADLMGELKLIRDVLERLERRTLARYVNNDENLA